MGRLLMELAVIECRMAGLALGGGEIGAGARSLARASYYLRLRAGEVREDMDEEAGDEGKDLAFAPVSPRLS
jgi:hypothetical protein